jgi:CBS domain-containing protein
MIEAHRDQQENLMKHKLVREVMEIGVPACKISTPLADVARLLSQEARDILVVMGETGVEGVVSQSDLARAFLSDYASMTAEEVMSTGMVSVSPDALLKTAVEKMIEKGFHQLLVMPDDIEIIAPLGVLSKRHLVELMAE